MKKKIFLHWFTNQIIGPNFGDEISAYIISNLTKCKIHYVPIAAQPSRMLIRGVRMFFTKKITFKSFKQVIRSYFHRNYIIGAGSILGYCSGSNAIVWGSGIMRQSDHIKPSQFLAVRGKKTQQRMLELGLNPPRIIGDPALLVNLVYNPNLKKKYRLGIIPHYSHWNYLSEYSNIPNTIVINITKSIENIIDDILACEHIISTSLHGLIVSHTYNIPALWFNITEELLHGDCVKFEDYFSSVNIDFYQPFIIPSLTMFNTNAILTIMTKNKSKSKINCNLKKIQKDLMSVAPFTVNARFYNKLSDYECNN